jgi:hypothetical protein
MVRTRRLAVSCALLLAILAPALPAAAWDQGEATALAAELEQVLGLVLASAEKAAPQETALQQRTRDAAVVEMRQAHEMSREYHSKLDRGANQDDTEHLFNQLRSVTRQARRTARDAVADPKVAPLLDRMDSLVDALVAQYDRG